MIAPQLAVGTVHIWQQSFDETLPPPPGCADVLDAAEQARAARFVRAADRHRFIRAHALLRRVLSAYGAGEAAALRFAIGAYGKPSLHGVGFNLSHSAGIALVAVAAAGVAVGIDVERVRPLPDAAALAAQCFAPEEAAAWRALPAADREAGLFRMWTRKEAFVKATGEGLSCDLRSFVVSLGAPPAILRPVLPDWSLHDLPAPPGIAAALAVSLARPVLRYGDAD